MVAAVRERIPAVIVTVTAIAWALAIAAEVTGSSPMPGHGHHSAPAPSPVLAVASWPVMLAAMMLPSSLGMLRVYGRLARARPHPVAAQLAFTGTYLVVWTVLGLAAVGAEAALRAAVAGTSWSDVDHWLIGGVVLIGAGIFQFTTLKDRCLTQCRTPVGFLVQRYRPGVGAAVQTGLAHAAFCVGCCWALMLVAFVAGTGNLLWMGALTTLMVAERSVSWGAAVARPAGIALILLGWLVLAHPAGLPGLLGPA